MSSLSNRELDQAEIALALSRRLPGYTPTQSFEPGSKGDALHQVFAKYMALLNVSARGLEERHRMAFLDMLGVHLLPAQAARAPLVFKLTPDCPVDITLAAESQVAAQPATRAPSIAGADASLEAPNAPPVLFYTEKTVTLARAKLVALYSVDPGSDECSDHSTSLTEGFTVFGDRQRMEHALYLGHDRLFKMGGSEITLLLQCAFDVASQRPLDIHWQYLTDVGWITLQGVEEDDTTRGLTRDGQIALRLERGPDAKRAVFNGRSSYWVRGTLNSPVIRGENLRNNPLTVNDLRIRVKFRKENLPPDAAFSDGAPLDVSKDFYPFSQQPPAYATFYLASAEVFERAGALVHIDLLLSESGTPKNSLALQWEYFDGNAWQPLGIVVEQTGVPHYNFDSVAQSAVRISFLCPPGWAATKVNGVDNHWLRVRIERGDFGKPLSVAVVTDPVTQAISTQLIGGDLAAPVVAKLVLSYSYLTDTEALDHCLARNNFVFVDHTEAARWSDRSFDPFEPVADLHATLHFGFDKRLPAGLVSLFVHVPDSEQEEPHTASPWVFEYFAREGWKQLGVVDETNGLRQSGMVEFIGPPDAIPVSGLGGDAFRVRARLKAATKMIERKVGGIWLNAVWAGHSVTVEREPLGNANGTPNQALRFARTPVLSGEVVEMREWSGNGEGWQLLEREVPPQDIRYERDPTTQRITAVWVRWHEQAHLYESTVSDRHFVVERSTGLIRFGNGAQGKLPQASSRIIATYRSGGGWIGNSPAGMVSQLRSAAPLVASVDNPIAAAGGADTEDSASVIRRGAQQLRHRNRAVSLADIEWVACDASPDVARARCLDITGPDGRAQRGWITVTVIPRSNARQPRPSPELKRRVADFLRDRVPATVAHRIRVVDPLYSPVGIKAEIVPLFPDQSAALELRLRQALDRFLHPLTGGPTQRGWGFGEALQLSRVAALIETTPGVDYAREIRLFVDGADRGEAIAVPRDTLLCAGDHELRLILGAP